MNNRFTFFTPTYNRADLISRVFVSLKEQELKNFEWIIIDDGSTDNTIEVVNEFINYADFPIKFISKSNQGKVRAINDALELASNEWFIVFDSDDWCDKNTTKVLTDEISSLEKMGIINSYCSISVLKRYKNGKIVGDDYSSINKYGCDYISRSMLGIKGDKWEIIKTSCHKNFRYELIGNEKYQAPSYVWIKMAEKYLTVFLNKSLSTIEYQEEGISKNNIYHRVKNVNTTVKYYEDIYGLIQNRDTYLAYKFLINKIRFKIHRGDSSFREAISVKGIIAYSLYFFDKIKLRKYSKV